MSPIVTSPEAARCLTILENADKPIVAADLAEQLRLDGCRETKRRHVRAIVKHLRDNDSMIVAVGAAGYYLTEDVKVWQDYLDGRQIDAKRILGETGKRKKEVAGKNQGLLFAEPKTMMGGN